MNRWLDIDYDVIRAVGQAIVMTPLSAIAKVGIASAKAGAASGLFNMMRNLGGAIGTAAVETFSKREQFRSFIINAHVSLLQPAARERIADLQQYSLTQGPAIVVDPQPLSGNLRQYSMARGRGCGGSMAPSCRRRRQYHPGAGDDHGLRQLLRLARRRAVGRHSPVALLRKGAATGGAEH